MKFDVSARYLDKGKAINHDIDMVFEQNLWDDYGYRVVYEVYLPRKSDRIPVHIGNISIADIEKAKEDIKEKKKYATYDYLKSEFTSLGDNVVSLGNTEYYENLNKRSKNKTLEFEMSELMEALNDIAYDLNKLNQIETEDVINTAFFRRVSKNLVKGRLNRLSRENEINISYNFKLKYYEYKNNEENENIATYEFDVDLKEQLPTNIYAIIGNNGSGKTRLLRDILKASLNVNEKVDSVFSNDDVNYFVEFNNDKEESSDFLGVMYLSFSPFDETIKVNKNENLLYKYIDLKSLEENDMYPDQKEEKLSEMIDKLKSDSLKMNMFWENLYKLNFVFEMLFNKNKWGNLDKEEYYELIKEDILNKWNEDKIEKKIKKYFEIMSSGEKIVFLSILFVVSNVEEKMIIIIDEPELFLHPPLLSNYIRILSEIVKNKNGLAIMATHSPIVLQEIPNKNIYLSKKNSYPCLEKMKIPTFGENISVLTNEVFGFDIRNSGFYRYLKDYSESEDVTSEKLYDLYNNYSLGGEAKFYLLGIILDKEEGLD